MSKTSNYDVLKREYRNANGNAELGSILAKRGIDMNRLPEAVRSGIGYVSKVHLEKKDASGWYPFTGIVAMLGDDEEGQLLAYPRYRKRAKNDSGIYFLGKVDVFNPSALRKGKQVVVVSDFFDALRLISNGIEAVSIGKAAPSKYLVPLIERVLREGNRIPRIYYSLPENKGFFLRKELDAYSIPCTDVTDAVATGAIRKDFPANQVAILEKLGKSPVVGNTGNDAL